MASSSSASAVSQQHAGVVGGGLVAALPRDRPEIVVPQLDRGGAGADIVAGEALRDAGHDPGELGAQLGAVLEVVRERRLGADGLAFALRHDRAVVVAAGHRAHHRAAAAEQPFDRGLAGGREFADGADAGGEQCLLGLGPDAPQLAHGPRREKRRLVAGGHDDEAVGLAGIGRDLRDALVGGDADADGEPCLLAHLAPDVARHRARAAEARRAAGGVEKRFVERERLHQRRHVTKDRHHLSRHLDVALEVRRHPDRAGTEAERAAHRHGGACPEHARLVRRRRDDAAILGAAADEHGLAAQLRVVELLDGREEGVEIGVQNRAGHARMIPPVTGRDATQRNASSAPRTMEMAMSSPSTRIAIGIHDRSGASQPA